MAFNTSDESSSYKRRGSAPKKGLAGSVRQPSYDELAQRVEALEREQQEQQRTRQALEEEVKKSRDELEKRVEERTGELRLTNRQLSQEIEDRNRIEEALRQNEKHFRDLIENYLTGICVILDDRTAYQNPEQERLFGSLPLTTVLMDQDRVHPDDVDTVMDFCRRIISGDSRTLEAEFRFYPEGRTALNGQMKWVHCRGSAIDYQGKRAILLNAMDVTRTKEMEHLLRIKDKMTSLGMVAAGMAHEIRNPLSGINIYLTKLKRISNRGAGNEGLSPIIAQIEAASTKIESVIRRVMDFSKPSTPRFVHGDMNTAIQEAVDLSSVTLRKSGIRIIVDLSPQLPACRMDVNLMEEVILNLIMNSAEAMRDVAGQKTIEITSRTCDNRIEVMVSDNGPGIPVALRDRIFDPFFTTKSESTGIGLSICHRIVTDHGGSLRALSSAPGGALMIVSVPATEPNASP